MYAQNACPEKRTDISHLLERRIIYEPITIANLRLPPVWEGSRNLFAPPLASGQEEV